MRGSVGAVETEHISDNKSLGRYDGVVALVGTPNSGKTTLFNWLTGSRFKTVNYPGSTVDYSLGTSHERFGPSMTIMDTPGTYSLDPKSPDELVTAKAIYSHKEFGAARLIVSIADATQLSRHLLLTYQLKEAGFRVILAVTMSDLLAEGDERLNIERLSAELEMPVVLIDGRLGGGVSELVVIIQSELESENLRSDAREIEPQKLWDADRVEARLKKTAELQREVIVPIQKLPTQDTKSVAVTPSTARMRTKKLDKILLHPFFGLVCFAVLMTTLFSSIFWLAAPFMDWVDGGLSFVGESILAINPESLFFQFLSNGVMASVAAVMVFVPQIFILFLGIIFLEDSGYLARSATLIDKPLALIGLGGRSFVPLLSGYACAVPAMMATRTINSRRERWLTLFIIPLMSCSARLPVFALLLAFLFAGEPAWKPGLMLAGLYLGSLLFGAVAAMIAGRFLKVEDRSFFMLELPVYRTPKLTLVIRQAWLRTLSYIKRAGPPIFVFALLVWLGTTFPRYDIEDPTERMSASYAAQLGQVIEPVFEPMGGDWRTGIGLISAFAAREVFVSSLAVIFHISDEDEATMQDGLLKSMQEAKAPDGYPLFTVASVLGLVIFFMIALQCLSTVMVAAREAGGWKFALMQLVTFNLAGYVLAVFVVQGLRAIGIS